MAVCSSCNIRKAIICVALFMAYLSPSVLRSQDSLTRVYADIIIKKGRPGLKIGDQLPDLAVGKIYNEPYITSARLEDFKGKPLILDFWHQYCSECIKEFNRLMELKKRFGDSIAILPVTFQSEASVRAFFSGRKKLGRGITLPTVVEDTLLRQLFPHNGDPHEVWIDKDGVVRAITDALVVTEANVEKLLKGERLELPLSYTDPDFTWDKPLLLDGNGGPDTAFVHRSIITRYNPVIKAVEYQRADSVATRIAVGNQTPVTLIKLAAGNSNLFGEDGKIFEYDFLNKRILLHTTQQRFLEDYNEVMNDYEKLEKFKRNNMFCYETIFPAGTPLQEAYEDMLGDLEVFFGVSVSVEKKKMEILKLIVMPGSDKLRTTGGKREEQYAEDNLRVHYKNQPLSNLVRFLNYFYQLPYIIDSTGYSGNVDMDLDLPDLKNLDGLKHALNKYGLTVIKDEAEMNVLVITDKKRKN